MLLFDRHVYVVEIKYAADGDDLADVLATAMAQIRETNYAKPYLNQQRTVHLLALAFSGSGVHYNEDILK